MFKKKWLKINMKKIQKKIIINKNEKEIMYILSHYMYENICNVNSIKIFLIVFYLSNLIAFSVSVF